MSIVKYLVNCLPEENEVVYADNGEHQDICIYRDEKFIGGYCDDQFATGMCHEREEYPLKNVIRWFNLEEYGKWTEAQGLGVFNINFDQAERISKTPQKINPGKAKVTIGKEATPITPIDYNSLPQLPGMGSIPESVIDNLVDPTETFSGTFLRQPEIALITITADGELQHHPDIPLEQCIQELEQDCDKYMLPFIRYIKRKEFPNGDA